MGLLGPTYGTFQSRTGLVGVRRKSTQLAYARFYLVLFPSTTEGHPVCDLDGRLAWGGCVRIHIHIELLQTVFLLFVAQHMFPVNDGAVRWLTLGWSIEPHRFLFHLGWPETCRLQARAQIGAMEKGNLGW